MVKKIPLTQDKFALVDDADFDELNQYKWYASFTHGIWYVQRSEYINGKQKNIKMHRQIMDFPSSKDIDHINHDGLDNRRYNLRVCNHSKNMKNRYMQKNNTSGLIGVSWNKRIKKWHAQIGNENKNIHIGYFENKEEANRAYNKKAIELFGEYVTRF